MAVDKENYTFFKRSDGVIICVYSWRGINARSTGYTQANALKKARHIAKSIANAASSGGARH